MHLFDSLKKKVTLMNQEFKDKTNIALQSNLPLTNRKLSQSNCCLSCHLTIHDSFHFIKTQFGSFLAFVPIRYDNITISKIIAESWEHNSIAIMKCDR